MKNNNQDLLDCAIAGYQWFRASSNQDIKQALPHIATSNYADAWLIGAWTGYHEGCEVTAIRSSRGHSLAIETRRSPIETKVIVENPYDHRDGVVVAKLAE